MSDFFKHAQKEREKDINDKNVRAKERNKKNRKINAKMQNCRHGL